MCYCYMHTVESLVYVPRINEPWNFVSLFGAHLHSHLTHKFIYTHTETFQNVVHPIQYHLWIGVKAIQLMCSNYKMYHSISQQDLMLSWWVHVSVLTEDWIILTLANAFFKKCLQCSFGKGEKLWNGWNFCYKHGRKIWCNLLLATKGPICIHIPLALGTFFKSFLTFDSFFSSFLPSNVVLLPQSLCENM